MTSKKSFYQLDGKGHYSRTSDVPETDTEIANALIEKFGKRATKVFIEDRTLELHGVPIKEIKPDEPERAWWE